MQSNSHIFHFSSNFLLLYRFYNDVGFFKYLKILNKLKTVKIIAFKMSTGTSIIMFFKFPKAQKSAYNIFHPTKKVSGFPVTSSAPELCCKVLTLKFSLPATKIYH